MTTPATTIFAAEKYTTTDDIKKYRDTCDAMQIDYFACKIVDFIDARFKIAPNKTVWDHQNLNPYEITLHNACTTMREYGAELEFNLIPTLNVNNYYTGANSNMGPAIICKTIVRGYFNDHVMYKNMTARAVLENIHRRIVAQGNIPTPTLFTAQTTAFNTYGIAVPYPKAASIEKS
jgi:hypothetical protein